MIIRADARRIPLIDNCADCCITSPPYFGLRDYGHGAQIGLEPTPEAFVASLVSVFREVRRVLKPAGTAWLNLGDSYAGATVSPGWREGAARADGNVRDDGQTRRNRNGNGAVAGTKAKDLIGIPWMVAFALRADGWCLRADIIWSKPNPMPESVTDRPTKAHEYLFLLTKSERYYYDAEAIREAASKVGTPAHLAGGSGERAGSRGLKPEYVKKRRAVRPSDTRGGGQGSGEITFDAASRNKRSVWTVPVQPYDGAHFATMPERLVEPCVLAGCPIGGLVFDPFLGSGTVGFVAERLGRRWVGTDLSYQPLAVERTAQRGIQFA